MIGEYVNSISGNTTSTIGTVYGPSATNVYTPHILGYDPYRVKDIKDLGYLMELMDKSKDSTIKTKLKELILLTLDSMYPANE